MNKKQPLLSICIPTWNRAQFLKLSLESFIDHIQEIDPSELELFVSDNCSEDITQEVVQEYIKLGLPITYNRNEENIGASRNFLKCMEWASGKYILLLGDDDLLIPGSVKMILDVLRDNDYGLVHIHKFKDVKEDFVRYKDKEKFLRRVSYWFTFMSGSIFRKEIVSQVNSDKYINTHLLQMPYYLLSAISKEENFLISKNIIKDGLDSANNGGYNFYEVFVKNYLNIWEEIIKKEGISLATFNWIKKDIYLKFIVFFNYWLLIRKRDIKSDFSNHNIGNRNGFKVANAKEILKEYYGNEWYYKFSWIYYAKFFIHNEKR